MNFNLMKKFLYMLSLVAFFNYSLAQVLITTNAALYNKPDDSAILQIADNNKGFLMPRMSSGSNIASPIESIIFYNLTSGKFNFWSQNSWSKMFEAEDAEAIIDVTKNFVGSSNSKTTITTFPNSMPTFTLNTGTTGWTDLNVSTVINVTKTTNTNLVTVEGMSQINNTDNASSYQFAIGVFVNEGGVDKLKIVRKFNAYSTNATCLWKKFNLSGVFENLSIGNHTVKVYAYNLPKMSNNYSNITYGGSASSNCNNLNTEMAKIYITAQLAQTGN